MEIAIHILMCQLSELDDMKKSVEAKKDQFLESMEVELKKIAEQRHDISLAIELLNSKSGKKGVPKMENPPPPPPAPKANEQQTTSEVHVDMEQIKKWCTDTLNFINRYAASSF